MGGGEGLYWEMKKVPGWSPQKMKRSIDALKVLKGNEDTSYFRLYALVREKYLLRQVDNVVVTNLPWFVYFMDKDFPLYEKFRSFVDEENAGGTKMSRRAHEFFAIMKTLQVSDSSPWFVVHPNLMTSLLFTRLRGVMPCDVNLPFPGFYVEIPPGFICIEKK